MRMTKSILAMLLITMLTLITGGCFSKTDVKQEEKKVETAKVLEKRVVTYSSVYPKMYFRGTSNAWGLQEMTLVANNIWTTTAKFGTTTTERFKFDTKGDWSVNFGDNNADFTCEQTGKDIAVKAGVNYEITFNDLTKKYTAVSLDEITWIGRTYNFPSGATITPNDELWINTKTFGKSTSQGGIIVEYTIEGVTRRAIMLEDGVEGNYYKSHFSLGKIEEGKEVKYKIFAVKGISYYAQGWFFYAEPFLVDDNAGKMYSVKSIFKTNLSRMYARGTFNNWGNSAMKLIADYTWSSDLFKTGTTETERFKFDIKGDWSNNYGDNNNDGVAEYFGKDISLAKDTYYNITFNENTKKYTLEKFYTLDISTTTTEAFAIVNGTWYYENNNKIIYKSGETVKVSSDMYYPKKYFKPRFSTWSGVSAGELTTEGTIVMNGNKELKAVYKDVETFKIYSKYNIQFSNGENLYCNGNEFEKNSVVSLWYYIAGGLQYDTCKQIWGGVNGDEVVNDSVLMDSDKEIDIALGERYFPYALKYSFTGPECSVKITSNENTPPLDPNKVPYFSKGTKAKIEFIGPTGVAIKGFSGVNGAEVINNEIIMDGDKEIVIETKYTECMCTFSAIPQEGTIKLMDTARNVKIVTGTIILFTPVGEIDISAIPAAGYRFKEWAGANASEIKDGKLVIDGPKEIKAVFEKVAEMF